MTHECNICDREFDSPRGLGVHKSSGHTEPYHDAEELRRQYLDEGKPTREIAAEYGIDHKQVLYWMDIHGIDRRDAVEAKLGTIQKRPASFGMDHQGYEFWSHKHDNTRYRYRVHRLLAIAEYGIDAVQDKHVHHKNEIPWDNRPENIELLSPSDHRKRHGLPHDDQGRFVSGGML